MAEAKLKRHGGTVRPLSPHLEIYSMPINMLMSIVHRITGAALYVGTVLFVWWLAALATGPAYYEFVAGIFGSWPGRIVLFGYTWALLHHLTGGIRHFIWDLGYGYDLDMVDKLSWGTLIVSAALTALIWLSVALVGGDV